MATITVGFIPKPKDEMNEEPKEKKEEVKEKKPAKKQK